MNIRRNKRTGLNINAKLVSSELQYPIMLPLGKCDDVEVDDNVHATCFRGVKFVFPAQDISGKIGYRDKMMGMWVPYHFENPLEIVGDVFVNNKLLLQILLNGDKIEIPVNGNSSWIRVREVIGLDDERSFASMRKSRAMRKIFEIEGLDATMTINV